MRLIDMHCDTNMILFDGKSRAIEDNGLHVDLKKLKAADSYVQFFASWFELSNTQAPFEHAMNMVAYFKNLIKDYPDFEVLTQKSQLTLDKRFALISVEEGGCMEGDLDKLQRLYREGVRSITMTWNFENELGYTNLDPDNRGLKPFGFEAICAMNDLGMIIDVSHLSDQGTADTIKQSRRPVVATHSNARSVKHHSRNLSDALIRGIANTGGVVGLNFWNELLGTKRTSRIEDMILHLDHLRRIGGDDILAIGTDYDGISGELEIPNISVMGNLGLALNKKGYSDDVIEKLFYKNAERVIKDVLE